MKKSIFLGMTTFGASQRFGFFGKGNGNDILVSKGLPEEESFKNTGRELRRLIDDDSDYNPANGRDDDKPEFFENEMEFSVCIEDDVDHKDNDHEPESFDGELESLDDILEFLADELESSVGNKP